MVKGYLANGLFSIGDRAVNEAIKNKLKSIATLSTLELYVPQDNAEINDKKGYASSIAIARADKEELLSSDFLIAVIDGVEIDSGVAAEIGVFSITGKPIYALYSDVRQLGNDNDKKIAALVLDSTENQFAYRNLFVIGLIKENGYITSNIEELCNIITRKELA